MADELIGHVVEGTITNVTNFGAFVSIDGGEEGLVHISEIANEFITDINQFVKIGEKINVKVLARNPKNKLELSIKQVVPNEAGSDGEAPKPIKVTRVKRNPNFEDKLHSFMKRSEERQIDVRRNLKNKQNIRKRKK